MTPSRPHTDVATRTKACRGRSVVSRQYVYVRELSGSPDGSLPLAEEIWERPAPFLRDRRGLCGQLEAHPADGHPGSVYPHVIVELPLETVEHARRTSGNKVLNALASQWRALHAASFGTRSLSAPRYEIHAATIPPQTLRVRFGPAIYVRDPTERAAWRLSWSCDGVQWEHTELALGQRLFVLGRDQTATIADPAWPFAAQLVIISEPQAEQLDLGCEPLGALKAEPAHEPGAFVVRSNEEGKCVYVRSERLARAEGAAMDDATVATANPAAPKTDSPSPSPGAMAVGSGAKLSLIGVLLPKLERFRMAHGQRYCLTLDEQGVPTPLSTRCSQSTRGTLIEVGRNGVALLTGGRKLILAAGESIALPNGEFAQVDAPPEGIRNYALCLKPARPITIPLPNRRFLFGRITDEALAPSVDRLRVLAGGPGAAAERFGLSRRHCLLEAAGEGLIITPLEKNSVTLLGPDLKPLETLTHGGPRLTAVVGDGEHLVIGPYVLRFDRGKQHPQEASS